MVRRLPRRIDRITAALEQGRLGLNVRLFADERDREVVTGLVHLALLTFLGAAIGIVAVLLLGTHGGPTITPTVSLFQVIGYNLIVVSSVLMLARPVQDLQEPVNHRERLRARRQAPDLRADRGTRRRVWRGARG